MNRKKIRVLWIWVLVITVSGCLGKPNKATKQACAKDQCIDVDVVWKQKDRQEGLQEKEKLDDDRGMLFIFENDAEHRFWMKNTLISLDIIWINKRKEIVNIAMYVPPCQKDPCPVYGPNEEARYVLEVNAGKSEMLGLKPGDRLTFR